MLVCGLKASLDLCRGPPRRRHAAVLCVCACVCVCVCDVLATLQNLKSTSPTLYTCFWSLALNDIYVPIDCYEVQMARLKKALGDLDNTGTQFTCMTSTKVQILTAQVLLRLGQAQSASTLRPRTRTSRSGKRTSPLTSTRWKRRRLSRSSTSYTSSLRAHALVA